MENKKAIEEQVCDWLKKQGYPLEMQVASMLRGNNFCVRQATHYLDVETGKSREVDVLATDADPLGMAEIHFVVECKAGNKPWILFTSADTLYNYNRFFALGILSDGARRVLAEKKFDELEEALCWLGKDGRIGYNITEAFTNRTDNTSHAQNTVVKSCTFLLEDNEGWTPPLIFAFPAIVISAPLFECFLDEDGEVRLSPIDQGWVFFDPRIPEVNGTCIRVISQAGLSAYSSEVCAMKDNLHSVIANDVKRVWQEFIKTSGGKDSEGGHGDRLT